MDNRPKVQKPYKYKIPSHRAPRFTLNRFEKVQTLQDAVPLTGYVNGSKATDIEERFARALRRYKRKFSFQVSFPVGHGHDDRYKVVDFVVFGGMALVATEEESGEHEDIVHQLDPEINYGPQVQKHLNRNSGGEHKELARIQFPIEVYGPMGHERSAERGEDAVRQALLNETFRKQGVQPLQVVWYWQLDNQDMADRTVRDLFL